MAAMFPMKHSTIFRSRWMALIWAAGIIWFALDIAGPGDSKSAKKGEEAQVPVARGAPGQAQEPAERARRERRCAHLRTILRMLTPVASCRWGEIARAVNAIVRCA